MIHITSVDKMLVERRTRVWMQLHVINVKPKINKIFISSIHPRDISFLSSGHATQHLSWLLFYCWNACFISTPGGHHEVDILTGGSWCCHAQYLWWDELNSSLKSILSILLMDIILIPFNYLKRRICGPLCFVFICNMFCVSLFILKNAINA